MIRTYELRCAYVHYKDTVPKPAINAIKTIRKVLNVSLREAKELYDGKFIPLYSDLSASELNLHLREVSLQEGVVYDNLMAETGIVVFDARFVSVNNINALAIMSSDIDRYNAA